MGTDEDKADLYELLDEDSLRDSDAKIADVEGNGH